MAITFDNIKQNLKIEYNDLDLSTWYTIRDMVLNNTAPFKNAKSSSQTDEQYKTYLKTLIVARLEFTFHRIEISVYRQGSQSQIEVECLPCRKNSRCEHKIFNKDNLTMVINNKQTAIQYNEFLELLYNCMANTLYYDWSQKQISDSQALSATLTCDEE